MFPQAIAEAEKGLALDPKWSAALNVLGFVYLDAGDAVKAEETLKKQVAVAPGEANPLDSLAFMYYLTGRLDEADRILQAGSEGQARFRLRGDHRLY